MCQVNDVECLKKKTRKDLADSVAVFEKDVREGRGPLRHYLLYNKKCVHGRDVYLECVYQGYLDAARRFAGIENIPNYKSLLFDIFADIAGGICFFTKDITTERQYDEWHNKTCMIIIQMLNARGYAAVTYGMAQKIVNMAMKYLYLVEKPAKDFLWQFCHIPLDSKILEWYRACVDPEQKTVWSNLDFEEYAQIQTKIRQYLSVCSFCPLEVEYLIWR